MSKRKKNLCIVLEILLGLILLAMVVLLWPASIDDSGLVSFSVDQTSVTAQEADFVLTNHTEHTMQWSDEYFIEKKGLFGWRKVIPVSVHSSAGYLKGRFGKGDSVVGIDWGDYYGKLARGTYRMVKEIWLNEKKYDTRSPIMEFYVAAEFTIP